MHKYHEKDRQCVFLLFRNRNKSVSYQCILFQLKFQTQKDPGERVTGAVTPRWIFGFSPTTESTFYCTDGSKVISRYSVRSLLQPPSAGNAKAQPRAFIACARAGSGCGRLCRELPRALHLSINCCSARTFRRPDSLGVS